MYTYNNIGIDISLSLYVRALTFVYYLTFNKYILSFWYITFLFFSSLITRNILPMEFAFGYFVSTFSIIPVKVIPLEVNNFEIKSPLLPLTNPYSFNSFVEIWISFLQCGQFVIMMILLIEC